MRWPGKGASEMRRGFPSRRFKPLRPGVPTARRWATVMVLPAPVTGQPAMIGARSGGKALAAKAGGPERRVHQGRGGADRLNTARGTPWDLADLRLFGLQHASMLRGVEVRGSERLVCAHCASLCAPRTQSVPRALGTSRERRTWTADCGSPGADQRIRAMSHVSSSLRARSLARVFRNDSLTSCSSPSSRPSAAAWCRGRRSPVAAAGLDRRGTDRSRSRPRSRGTCRRSKNCR